MAQITDTEKQQALTYIKGKFKRMYINNAENMFNNLERNKMRQLFELDEEIIDFNHFKALMNTNTQFRDNALRFIKVE